MCIRLDFNIYIIKLVVNRARTNSEVGGYGWLATAHVKQDNYDTERSTCGDDECAK